MKGITCDQDNKSGKQVEVKRLNEPTEEKAATFKAMDNQGMTT